MRMDDESRRCLMSLHAREQRYYVSSLQEKLFPSTKKWVLKEAEYVACLSNKSRSQVLWIHGRPGLGKSCWRDFCSKSFERFREFLDLSKTAYWPTNFLFQGQIKATVPSLSSDPSFTKSFCASRFR